MGLKQLAVSEEGREPAVGIVESASEIVKKSLDLLSSYPESIRDADGWPTQARCWLEWGLSTQLE